MMLSSQSNDIAAQRGEFPLRHGLLGNERALHEYARRIDPRNNELVAVIVDNPKKVWRDLNLNGPRNKELQADIKHCPNSPVLKKAERFGTERNSGQSRKFNIWFNVPLLVPGGPLTRVSLANRRTWAA